MPTRRAPHLPDLNLYAAYVEPTFAPRLSVQKRVNAPKPNSWFVTYGPESLFQFAKAPKRFRPHRDDGTRDEIFLTDPNARANAAAMGKAFSAHGVARAPLRGCARAAAAALGPLLGPHVQTLDVATLLAPECELPFDYGVHLVNEGGFELSIALGTWLRDLPGTPKNLRELQATP